MAGPPQRIVSLVPSLTELLCWLGAGDRLVGRTQFCVEPPGLAARVPAFGGTKTPRVREIVALAPDLVIANKEENRREDVEALQAAGLPVLLTDPTTVRGAVATVREIGAVTGCAGRADALATDIERELARRPATGPRVFVAVWRKPLMGLGSDSYGHDLLEAAGAANVLAGRPRYPEVTLDELGDLRPDLILLPNEPYRFEERHVAEFAPLAPARVVDGKVLWWYGPRIPAALRALRDLFNGSVGRPGDPGRPSPPR
ncbi:MAG: helical backbone metal receptor [Dehalococcoidia bacterium]